MVEGESDDGSHPASWCGSGAARARGRSASVTAHPPPGRTHARPRRADQPHGGTLQGAWATRQERAHPRSWRQFRVLRRPACRGWGVPVAESVLAPPGPIPNPVVTQRSAGEYCGGDPTGGEAAAGTPHPQPRTAAGSLARWSDGQPARRPAGPMVSRPGGQPVRRNGQDDDGGRPSRARHPTRGGAAAARWAHNPKVGGSNPPPATSYQNATEQSCSVAFCCS